MSIGNREMTLKDALQLADKAIDDLYEDLADLAFSYSEPSPSPLSPDYVKSLLERRKADQAGRDKLRLLLLEMISREYSIIKESEEGTS
jgi:hypothetical protein